MSSDYLSNIPRELRQIISEYVLPEYIPSLCRVNKTFKEQCGRMDFWLCYFARPTIAESQDLLHDVLVAFAGQRCMKMFIYLWNANLRINNIQLIKERRTLLECYKKSILINDDEFAHYIFSLNPKWIEARCSDETGYQEVEYFRIMLLLINSLKNNNVKEFIKIP